MKFLTKKSSLFVFVLFATSFIFLQTVKVSQICTENGVRDWACTEYLGIFKTLLLYTTVLLLPLFIVLPLNSSVFEAWKKFAVWAVPSVLVIVTALSFVEPGGSIGGMVEQRMLATAIIGLYAAYAIVSVSIIGTAWQKSRKS